jgi:subtilisin family serine protease
MTSAADVDRRFEIHVGRESDLDAARQLVEEAVSRTQMVPRFSKVRRPPVLEVRLEGGVAASIVTAAVARIVERLPLARVHNDVMNTRTDARKGLVYPDPKIGVTIDGDAPARRLAGPVTVAIVDSGLMVEHPDFEGHLWNGPGGRPGKQFIKNPDGTDRPFDDLRDRDGHGTLVAGSVLAAAGDTPVKLMVAKFFDADYSARPDNAARALDFAVANGAKVIVLAWDVGIGSIALERAFREACQHALVVVAAGNYGSDNDWHDGRTLARAPVRYAKDHRESTLVVMAADESRKAWFSNYGRETVDLAAPGMAITSTRRCLSLEAARTPAVYRPHGGTSAAAALVAGAAALLMSRYPGLGVDDVKRCLTRSVDKFPGLKCQSQGCLNIPAALECVKQAVAKTAAVQMGAAQGTKKY